MFTINKLIAYIILGIFYLYIATVIWIGLHPTECCCCCCCCCFCLEIVELLIHLCSISCNKSLFHLNGKLINNFH